MTSNDVKTILSSITDGRVRDFRYRQRQFHSLYQWIVKHSAEIQVAAQKDDHLSDINSKFLVASVLSDLRNKYNCLDFKRELSEEYSVKHNRDHVDRRTPEDLIYLVPETYTLFAAVIGVICACLCSGSCCIVALPTDLKHSTTILKQCFRDALDKTAFATITEPPSEDVIQQCLLIDQTQSMSVRNAGRALLSQREAWTAVIVDRTADLDQAAREIVHARSFGGSQSPYTPTCILVNEFVEKELTELLHKYAGQVETLSTNGTMNESINGSVDGSIHSTRARLSLRTKDSQSKLQTRKFDFVKVTERSDINIHSTKKTSVLPLLAVSSYDDAIDVLSTSAQMRLLALYVFAGPLGAKYLAQFIHSQVTFINHIPINLLVGPAAPIDYAVSPIARYRREMLERASPVLVHPARGTFTASGIDRQNIIRFSTYWASSLAPLEPIGQAEEGDMNFFVQGIYTGFAMVVIPVILGMSAAGGYGLFTLFKYLT